MSSRRLVLASASPRRHELLTHLKIPFQVYTSSYDETGIPFKRDAPGDWVMELAHGKAMTVARQIHETVVVVGADTTVVVDGDNLGKPVDEEDAVRMLRRLSGRSHQVYTGVCVVSKDHGRLGVPICRVAVTDVYFATIPESDIATYVAGGEPMDKAGAYGIQGDALSFIPKIEGDYYNVVGLPLTLMHELLAPLFPDIASPPAQPTFPFPELVRA